MHINLLTNISAMQVHIEWESKSSLAIQIFHVQVGSAYILLFYCVYSTEVPSGLGSSI